MSSWRKRLRAEARAVKLVLRHPRTPKLSKALLIAGLAYFPFPLASVLSTVLILAAAAALPDGLLAECRVRARARD